MTANDIVKDLESVIDWFTNHGSNTNTAVIDISQRAIDVINRQKAEIERLKEYEDIRPTGCPNCHRGNFLNSKFCSHCGKQLQGKKKDVKAEAIREFADRLKEKLSDCRIVNNYVYTGYDTGDTLNSIDNLVKEMPECYIMSCNDCVHCDRCSNFESGFSAHCADVSKCKHFRNKADFAEVVRCKDCCKYSGKYCLLTDDEEDRREPDDFCSYGERKEE